MRAFYRIKRADWPLTREGEDGPEDWQPDCVEVGRTQGFIILHSGIYPNPDLEALSGSKFLGNTYAELKHNVDATMGQRKAVFGASYDATENIDGVDTAVVLSRKMAEGKRVEETLRREWIIPHSWGGRESVREQADVDATI